MSQMFPEWIKVALREGFTRHQQKPAAEACPRIAAKVGMPVGTVQAYLRQSRSHPWPEQPVLHEAFALLNHIYGD